MSEMKFVGFAASPKQREGTRLQFAEEILELNLSYKNAAAALLTREAAEKWLGKVKKWELTVGTKLEVLEGALMASEVVVVESNLPKSITLVADSFGELRITFEKQAERTLATLKFSRWSLEDERNLFDHTVEQIFRGARSVF